MAKIKEEKDFIQLENTELLEDFLIGSILGDGYITKDENKYFRLSLGHGSKQLKYLEYKVNILNQYGLGRKITKCINKSLRYKEGFCITYHTKSCNHPIFKKYREQYYPNNKKNIMSLNYISPQSLAIWFMDDGCKCKSSYQIYTDSFSKEEVEHLINILKTTYDLTFTFDKNKVLYLKKSNISKFNEIIKPYLLKEFFYKLHKGSV